MLWVKAIHVIGVVCWFAMLFYLPRLFVYHAMATEPQLKDQFKIMERRLYFGIGMPSLVVTVVFGLWTTWYAWAAYAASTWFWLKMALVATLVIYHFVCGHFVRKFRDDNVQRSHVFFRWFNEYPTVVLIAVVIMVIVKLPA